MSAPVVASPVVQAIGAAFSAALVGDLDGFEVLDAAEARQGFAERSVTVGGVWDPDISAVATDQTVQTQVTESGAARHRTETTQVGCIVYSGDGSSDLATHRANVGAALSALRGAVSGIVSIDGRACRVQVVDESWAQGADERGWFVLTSVTVQAVRLL